MAVRSATRTAKPDRCPCCGHPYAFRVAARKSNQMNLTRHYRCGRDGRYVYVHQISYE